MEHERLEYKIVMQDGADSEILARLAHLDIAGSAYMTSIARFPKRNIQLRHGARIIERHDGEPPPAPIELRVPNLRSWSVHLIGGRKLTNLEIKHHGYRMIVHRDGPMVRLCSRNAIDRTARLPARFIHDEQRLWCMVKELVD